jgi:hypothetical protein
MQKCRWTLILLLGAAFSAATIVSSNQQVPDRHAERIYFSALNKEEKPVPGLTAADFQLRIDGKPAAMEGFRPGLPPGDRSIPLVAWVLMSYGKTISGEAIQRQAGTIAAAFSRFHPASVMGIKLISEMSETLSPLAHDPKGLRSAFLQYSERRAELRVGIQNGTVSLGGGGMWRAVELALDEMNDYIVSNPAFRDREVHRAVMIISAGDMSDQMRNYNPQVLYTKAARYNAFLYPIVVPTPMFDQWVTDYYDLAKKTAGLASIFGAIRPGAQQPPFSRNNQASDAMDVNFFHMARDLNGKYSFTVTPPFPGQQMHIEVKCKVKGVNIRLARTTLP